MSLRLTRNHSRTRRLTRFLVTALPTFRLTVMPSRGRASLWTPEGSRKTTNARTALRRPRWRTCRNSLGRSSRSCRRNGPVGPATATSKASRPPGACGPSPGGASVPPGPPWSSCGTGSRERACAGFGWAGRCASSDQAFRWDDSGPDDRRAPQGSQRVWQGQRGCEPPRSVRRHPRQPWYILRRGEPPPVPAACASRGIAIPIDEAQIALISRLSDGFVGMHAPLLLRLPFQRKGSGRET